MKLTFGAFKSLPVMLFLILAVTLACTLNGCKEKAGQEAVSDADKNAMINPLLLNDNEKSYLISVAYEAINDYFLEKPLMSKTWSAKYDNTNTRVYVILWLEGERVGSWYTLEENLAHTVYSATIKNLKNVDAKEKIRDEDIDDIKVHIQIMGDYFPLNQGFQRGLHGLRFAKGSKGANYYATYATEGNYKTEKLMRNLCKKAGLDEDCYQDPTVEKYHYEVLHFGTTRYDGGVKAADGERGIVTFYRGNVLEDNTKGLNIDRLKRSYEMGVHWMVNDLNDDGYFKYEYFPSSGEYSTKNNMIRQLMNSKFLALLSQNNETIQQLHKKNLEFIFNNWYQEAGENREGDNGEGEEGEIKDGEREYGYIYFNNKSKLGAMGMALCAVAYSPFFDEYKDKAEKLANTILHLQNDDGSMEPWFIKPNYTYDKEYLLKFYTGEAILALIELYLRTNNTKYLNAAIKSQDYYVDKYAYNLKDNYYPAYVPWHAQTLNKLYKITKDEKYVEAIFIMNDELLKIQNTNHPPFEPYKDMHGRFFSPEHPEYGYPHSSSDGVYVEGITYAYEIAVMVGDEERTEKYKQAIIIGVHNLINLQYSSSKMYFMHYPERVEGAMKVRADDNRIRIDTTQHALDGFMKLLDLYEIFVKSL